MNINSTSNHEYTEYYLKKYNIWYRRLFPIDIPFKFIAKSCCRGKILDIGCGPGRYLSFFPDRAVGVDHNKDFVEYTRERGFHTFYSKDFLDTNKEEFDTLLFSHILEHMNFQEGITLIKTYLPFLRKEGRIVIIVPHGYCFKNDPTHILYYDKYKIDELAFNINLKVTKSFYHPFPDFLSKWFITDGIYILKQIK